MAGSDRRAARSAAAVLALLSLGSAHAQGPAACWVRSRSSQWVVLICTPDAGEQVWRVRSQAACADQSRCNVWIWEQPAKAPESAPSTDADITLLQASAALALWINESQSLVKLRGRR
jgi:hypothetical protein